MTQSPANTTAQGYVGRTLRAAAGRERFTAAELAAEPGLTRARVGTIVRQWARNGWIEDTGDAPKPNEVWQVTDAGREALGEAAADLMPVAADAEQNMWRAIRNLRSFSPTDVQGMSCTEEAPVSRRRAAKFCRMLEEAGYLRVVRGGVPGRREPIYRLIRNSGRLAPVERRVRATYDPNEDRYVHVVETRR